MDVQIVEFPETAVAVVEHRGPPEREYETSRKLIEWRIAHRLSSANHRTYGVHHTDPQSVAPADHRVDFCVSYDQPVEPNPQGVIGKVIPASRCAVARHLGSRRFNAAAVYVHREWLPTSGERAGGEMITDVYLPLA